MENTSTTTTTAKAPADAPNEPHRKSRRQPKAHSLAVGTILVSTWGWEQTNVEFYQVVRVTPRTVVIRGIQYRVAEDLPYFAQDKVTAVRDAFDTYEFRRTVSENGYISVGRWKVANEWDGEPVLRTRYA